MRIRKGWMLCLGILALFFGSAGSLSAGAIYITGTTEPWGSPDNVNAMNTAFGSGNWTQNNFTNAVANGSFSTSRFVFIDGSDGNDAAFTTFMSSNIALLQNFVANGGSLFINAATWSTSPISLGFGATLNHNNYDSGAGTASAVNPAHPVFNGPNGATGSSWTGSFFSHNYITGGGYTTLIKDGLGRSDLVAGAYGAGYIMLGGMTTPNWQQNNAQANNLRANELDWGASFVTEVPVPAGVVMAGLGAGLLGCVQFIRRRHLARA